MGNGLSLEAIPGVDKVIMAAVIVGHPFPLFSGPRA